MIVRILNEGQYRVSDDIRARLEELDRRAVEALDRETEEELDGILEQMAQVVRTQGERLPPEDLSPSDVIIPPPDMTLEETRELFDEQGLIPDLPV